MNEVKALIQALAQTVGNKVYLRDLEKLFSSKDLSAQEKETLRYLSRDIRELGNNSKNRFPGTF